MKSWMFVIVAFCVTGLAFAEQAPPQVEHVLKVHYPKAQTQLLGSRQVNGVKVFDFKVTNPNGDSTAIVTEHGDFLPSSVSRSAQALPNRVRRVTEALFGSQPKEIEEWNVTHYFVDVEADGRPYQIKFSAIGLLRDIAGPSEVRSDDLSKLQKVTDEPQRKTLMAKAAEYLKDPKQDRIKEIYREGGPGNLFLVHSATGKGDDQRIIMDAEGNVHSGTHAVQESEVPKPIVEAIHRLFPAEKIKGITRTWSEFYQLQQPTPGGEMLTIRIRPNGEVMSIISPQQVALENQAVQAGHRTGAAKP